MRSVGFVIVLVCSSIAGPAAAAVLPDARPPPTGERVMTQPQSEREPPSRQQEQLSMISSIPRWPFIAAAGGVFVIMALLGLRRRR